MIDHVKQNDLTTILYTASIVLNNDRFLSGGDLNYLLTVGILRYLKKVGISYEHQQLIFNSLFDVRELFDRKEDKIRGALLCCAIEFNRRQMQKYEDLKIKDNGDVYREN